MIILSFFSLSWSRSSRRTQTLTVASVKYVSIFHIKGKQDQRVRDKWDGTLCDENIEVQLQGVETAFWDDSELNIYLEPLRGKQSVSVFLILDIKKQQDFLCYNPSHPEGTDTGFLVHISPRSHRFSPVVCEFKSSEAAPETGRFMFFGGRYCNCTLRIKPRDLFLLQ